MANLVEGAVMNRGIDKRGRKKEHGFVCKHSSDQLLECQEKGLDF